MNNVVEEATQEERAPKRAWKGLIVLAVSLGMIVLDHTIVGVAMPAIVQGLRLDLTDAQWITTLYSVVFAALLLTMGRIGDILGRRGLLIVGLVLFTAGSVLAAAAQGVAPMLWARGLQGVGGAMILPSTLSTVNATFRGRDRAAAFGIWGAVMASAAAIGPLAGGLLTQWASWPWIFWVNVPVALALLVLAMIFVDETRGETNGLDLMGTFLSAIGFGSLVFGLVEGGTLGWWGQKAPLVLGSWRWPESAPVSAVPIALGIGLVAIAAFVSWELWRSRRRKPAVLDVKLFMIPTFTLGNITASLVAVGEFALLFVLPLFLITSLKLSMIAAGLVLSAMAFGAFLSGASARHLAARIGAERVVVLGLALEVAGTAAMAFVAEHSSSGWAVAACLVPYGLGLGLASAQLTSTTLREVPKAASGVGSATQSTMRQVGTALGSAIGGAVLAAMVGSGREAFSDPRAFAHGASISIWVATGLLVVALGCSVVLHKVSRLSTLRVAR